jgi:hypothetical protein
MRRVGLQARMIDSNTDEVRALDVTPKDWSGDDCIYNDLPLNFHPVSSALRAEFVG